MAEAERNVSRKAKMKTVTLNQILLAIRVHKTCSEIQARRYLKQFGIEAVGIRQRPQRYPEDAAERILRGLGYEPEVAAPEHVKQAHVPSMAELRTERRKGGRK